MELGHDSLQPWGGEEMDSQNTLILGKVEFKLVSLGKGERKPLTRNERFLT